MGVFLMRSHEAATAASDESVPSIEAAMRSRTADAGSSSGVKSSSELSQPNHTVHVALSQPSRAMDGSPEVGA